MRPDRLRNHWRFTGCSAATLTLASTAPALAAYSNTAIIGNAPLTIAIGAGAFAVLAMLALRRRVRDGETDRLKAAGQIAGLRAQLDEYEALALKLARDGALLAGFKATLARNRTTSALFDTDLYRRHIESAYVTMWERSQRGEPPASFAVSAAV